MSVNGLVNPKELPVIDDDAQIDVCRPNEPPSQCLREAGMTLVQSIQCHGFIIVHVTTFSRVANFG
jgi:hypothetical protein